MSKQKHEKFRLSSKAGKPPGTLVYTGIHDTEAAEMSLISFRDDKLESARIEDIAYVFNHLKNEYTNWINVNSLNDVKLIEQIGQLCQFHPLILEDILNVQQLPKTEVFDNYIYCAVQTLKVNETNGKIESEYISLILGQHFLISFQERKGDVFDAVRNRIELSSGRIRTRGDDYLLYALIDVIVDHYYGIIEYIGDELTEMEDRLLASDEELEVQEIVHVKRQLMSLKKALFPMRDSVRNLMREDVPFIDETTRIFFNDVYDHVNQLVSEMESQREIATSLMDLYNSEMSNKMNQVMKILTIVGAIFIPLTFIAGIYGMNFQYMPELQTENGYFIALAVMAVMGVSMFMFMRSKRWF